MKTDTQILIEKLRVLAGRMDVLRIQSAKDVAEAADQLQELFIQNREQALDEMVRINQELGLYDET